MARYDEFSSFYGYEPPDVVREFEKKKRSDLESTVAIDPLTGQLSPNRGFQNFIPTAYNRVNAAGTPLVYGQGGYSPAYQNLPLPTNVSGGGGAPVPPPLPPPDLPYPGPPSPAPDNPYGDLNIPPPDFPPRGGGDFQIEQTPLTKPDYTSPEAPPGPEPPIEPAPITEGPIYAADGFDGIVDKPTTFVAGEAGPERVKVVPQVPMLPTANTMMPNRRVPRKMGTLGSLMGR